MGFPKIEIVPLAQIRRPGFVAPRRNIAAIQGQTPGAVNHHPIRRQNQVPLARRHRPRNQRPNHRPPTRRTGVNIAPNHLPPGRPVLGKEEIVARAGRTHPRLRRTTAPATCAQRPGRTDIATRHRHIQSVTPRRRVDAKLAVAPHRAAVTRVPQTGRHAPAKIRRLAGRTTVVRVQIHRPRNKAGHPEHLAFPFVGVGAVVGNHPPGNLFAFQPAQGHGFAGLPRANPFVVVVVAPRIFHELAVGHVVNVQQIVVVVFRATGAPIARRLPL